MKLQLAVFLVVALGAAISSVSSDCSSRAGGCSANTGRMNKAHTGGVVPEERQVQIPEKPNIIFIYGDDVGYGDLNGYGHPTSRYK